MVKTRPSPQRSGEGGYTLVEVVVAMLLIGLASAMCMPVFLSGRMSEGRSDRRAAAADAVHRLTDELKGYVTADPALADGPGAGIDGWYLPGDLSGLRALQAGSHTLDPGVWAAPLAPFGGAVSYTVAVRATPSGPQPDVAFLVSWQEP